jgi:hypothetical protein
MVTVQRVSPSPQLDGIFSLSRSDWDLNICLSSELRRKQLKKPECFNAWADLRLIYCKFYDRRPQGLRGALQDVGIAFEGREHSGLVDAQNTARLAWKLMQARRRHSRRGHILVTLAWPLQEGCVIVVTRHTIGATVDPRLKNMTLSTAAVSRR